MALSKNIKNTLFALGVVATGAISAQRVADSKHSLVETMGEEYASAPVGDSTHLLRQRVELSQRTAQLLQQNPAYVSLRDGLLSQCIFDEQLGGRVLFSDTAITDAASLAILEYEQISLAQPNKLQVMTKDPAVLEQLRTQGYVLEPVMVDVYELTVSPTEREQLKSVLQKTKGVDAVIYNKSSSSLACVGYNDPLFALNNGISEQSFLSDSGAVLRNSYIYTHHGVDKMDAFNAFLQPSTAANPNVVNYSMDEGGDTANVETPNMIGKRNFEINSNVVSPGNHGNGTLVLTIGAANNNVGGLGTAHDYPRWNADVGSGGLVSMTAVGRALDTAMSYCAAHPNSRLVLNMSFAIFNDPVIHAKITALTSLTTPAGGQQVFVVKSAGNSGPGTLDPAAAWAEVFGIGGVLNGMGGIPPLWAGSSTGPGIFGVADGQGVATMFSTNGTYNQQNGTSFSAPIVTGAIMRLLSQDPTLTQAKLIKRLRAGAFDLGPVGYDTAYGHGYLRAYESMKYAVVEDFPNADMVDNYATPLDCQNNPGFIKDFIPKFFNVPSAMVRQAYYPNGQPIPYTTNGNGERVFHVNPSAANGFAANNNQISYAIAAPGQCVDTIKTMPFAVTNMALPTPPATPILANGQNFVPPVCANNVVKVKVTNPPVGGSVAATLNGVSVPYNAADSMITLSGGMSAPSDTLHVVSTNAQGSTPKDSIFTVQNALTPSIGNLTAPVVTTCQGNAVTFTAPAVANAGGATISYQWYDNGTPIAGATMNPYSYPAVAAVGNHNIHVVATLTGGTGCYTSMTATSPVKALTIQANTSPTVTIPTALPTANCVGSSVTLTANGTFPMGSTFQWQNQNGVNIPGATTNPYTGTLQTAPADTFKVVVTMPNGGCYLTPAVQTSPNVIVNVNPVTSPTVNIPTANPMVACVGTSVALNATGTFPIGSTFQWQRNGTNIVGATTNPYNGTLVSAPADTFRVVVTFPAGGCYVTPSVTSGDVIVAANAVTSPAATPASVSDLTPCLGTTISATANVANIPLGAVYTWKLDGVVQSGFTGPTCSINTTGLAGGTHAITYEITLPAGCYVGGNFLVAGATNINVVVPTTPTVSSTNVVAASICEGDTTTFSLTTNAIPVGAGYQWYLDGSPVVGATSATYLHNGIVGAGSDAVHCVITLPPGCYTVAGPLQSPTNTIMVNPSITPVSDMTPNNQSICITQSPSGTWNINAVGGANYTHQLYWTNPANLTTLVGTANPGSVPYPALTASPGTNKFFIKSTYIGGATCALQTVYSDTTTVDVQAQLVSDGTLTGPNEVCDTLNFSITATPAMTVANGSSAQLWKKVGATLTPLGVQTTVGMTPLNFTTNLPFNEQAEFFVTFTPPVGTCYLQGNSDTAIITNNGMHKDTIVGSGNTYTLQNPAPGSTQRWQKWNTNTLQWDDIPGETATTYTAATSGLIRVFSTKGGCVSWSDSIQHTMVSVNNHVKPEDIITIAPNPTNGLIQLGNLKAGATYAFELVDMTGRSIKLETGKDQTASGTKASIDMSIYAAGTYMIRVRDKTHDTWQVLKVFKR